MIFQDLQNTKRKSLTNTSKRMKTFKKIAVGEDNFYFIYKSKAVILKDKIASYELIPLGFIHNTDDEYYYYSFDGNCQGYEDIVKKFVEECLI